VSPSRRGLCVVCRQSWVLVAVLDSGATSSVSAAVPEILAGENYYNAI